MRLVFSTKEFIYNGLPRPGFPIVLGDDMQPVQPFQDFLLWRLLGRGFPLSRLTWEGYGRRLWDYAMFLKANELVWDQPFDVPGRSVVSRYRDWSLRDLNLCRSTLNSRLRIVADFYKWAHETHLIDALPFSYRRDRCRKVDSFLMHVGDVTPKQVPSLIVSEWSAPPEFLTQPQLQIVRRICRSATRRLLLDLMARVGLRSVEARTFPLRYVFNPARRADCRPGQMLRLRLDPKDMETKFSKPRDVDVPYSLMEDMYAYTLYERSRLASTSPISSTTLLLTATGHPFSKDAVVEAFHSLSEAAGFRVTALMLRHSYAIHTLARLRARRDYNGEPLLYVRDRLGHSNVQTTLVYLRQIEQLAGSVALAVEDEFNTLFRS